MKTNPTGIRFEVEDLDFIKARERLDTPQQVVYFLCSEYCRLHRMSKPLVFSAEKDRIYDASEVNLNQIDFDHVSHNKGLATKISDLGKPTKTIKNITEPKPATNYAINTKEEMPDGLNWKQKLEWKRNH